MAGRRGDWELASWFDQRGGLLMLASVGLACGLLILAMSLPIGRVREIGGLVETVRFSEVIRFGNPVTGLVRLADGREVGVVLPEGGGCRPGDTVAVLDFPKLWGHEFRAGIAGCDHPSHRGAP